MTGKRLLLLVPAAVVLAAAVVAAAVAGTAAVVGSNQSTTCAKTSVDLGSQGSGDDDSSSSVNLVVIANGSGTSSVSVSQRVVQSDGRSEVDIDVEYGDQSLTITGETVENGSLVLNATRNDTVLNESIVVNGSDDRDVVVRIDGNGDLRISREDEPGGCACDASLVDFGVTVGTDDDDAGNETDGGREIDCSGSVVCQCSDSATEISPPVRQSRDSTRTGIGVMRVFVRPTDFAGLAMPGRAVDCTDAADGATSGCHYEPDTRGG